MTRIRAADYITYRDPTERVYKAGVRSIVRLNGRTVGAIMCDGDTQRPQYFYRAGNYFLREPGRDGPLFASVSEVRNDIERGS